MSDTPRTDEMARMPTDAHPTWVVPVDFARQLERELHAQATRTNNWHMAYQDESSRRVQMQLAYDADIKRLEWFFRLTADWNIETWRRTTDELMKAEAAISPSASTPPAASASGCP